MSCPYLRDLKKPRCGVFDCKYQPSPYELEHFCKTTDFVNCKIYNFYFTTCAKIQENKQFSMDYGEGLS